MWKHSMLYDTLWGDCHGKDYIVKNFVNRVSMVFLVGCATNTNAYKEREKIQNPHSTMSIHG